MRPLHRLEAGKNFCPNFFSQRSHYFLPSDQQPSRFQLDLICVLAASEKERETTLLWQRVECSLPSPFSHALMDARRRNPVTDKQIMHEEEVEPPSFLPTPLFLWDLFFHPSSHPFPLFSFVPWCSSRSKAAIACFQPSSLSPPRG